MTELVVRRALEQNGIDLASLKDWKPTRPRLRFTPRTRAGKDALIMEEVTRMKEHAKKSGGAYQIESMHINGPVPYQTVVPMEAY